MHNLTPYGIKVKKRLIDMGLSSTDLAKQIGTSKQYLNYILYGQRSGKKYLRRISDALELEPPDEPLNEKITAPINSEDGVESTEG